MRDILLINVSVSHNSLPAPPLGLGSLASVIHQEGLGRVKILDLDLYREPYRKLKSEVHALRRKSGVIYGLMMTTHNRFTVQRLSAMIRNLHPSSEIICGGPHMTLSALDTMENCPDIDIGFIGESERTIVPFLENRNPSMIKGIAFRKDGKIIINPKAGRITDLDSLPFPDRKALRVEKYPQIPIPGTDKKRTASMFTTRGCPFNCVFCSSFEQWDKKTIQRSPENMMQEVELLVKEYDVDGIFFQDDLFVVSRKRTERFCRMMIDSGLSRRISWFCRIRADSADFDLLRLMKRAGCRALVLGVESGDPDLMSKVVNKRITPAQVMDTVRWIRRLGFSLCCTFTISYPGETMAMVRRTLALRERMKCQDKPLYLMRIYPGTEIFRDAVKKGYLPEDFSWFSADVPSFALDKFTKRTIIPMYRDLLSRKEYRQLREYINSENLKRRYAILRKIPFRIPGWFMIFPHQLRRLVKGY